VSLNMSELFAFRHDHVQTPWTPNVLYCIPRIRRGCLIWYNLSAAACVPPILKSPGKNILKPPPVTEAFFATPKYS